MIRKIIKINSEKCDGCGLCVDACHEGAIAIVDGKAKLLRDDYCDGLGNCLPVCPTGAITFEEREASAYNEASAFEKTGAKKAALNESVAFETSAVSSHAEGTEPLACGCPGSSSRAIHRPESGAQPAKAPAADTPGELRQWPVQIKLVPVNAPYFNDAHLLVAADCAAYAHGAFHSRFMKNRITLIGCPKLDDGDYSQKLGEIISRNSIKSVTVVRMEVPCCGGIEHAVVTALKNSGKFLPWQVYTLSTGGEILED